MTRSYAKISCDVAAGHFFGMNPGLTELLGEMKQIKADFQVVANIKTS